MDTIKKQYEASLKGDLDEIRTILDSLGMSDPNNMEVCSNILGRSCDNLTSTWISGRKYVRTYYIMEAFPAYSKHAQELSIKLDAMVNLLDDLLDENLSREEKALYIVELLRIISNFSRHNKDKTLSDYIGRYFNELICIASLEDIYCRKIEKEKDKFELIDHMIKIYDCKSNDMNIFADIALQDLGISDKASYDAVKSSARHFRAINLISKDLNDIEHDLEQGTDSIIILVKDNYGKGYKEVLQSVVGEYLRKIESLEGCKDPKCKKIISGLLEMSNSEAGKFRKNLSGI